MNHEKLVDHKGERPDFNTSKNIEFYMRADHFTCTENEKNKIEQTIEDNLYVIGGIEEIDDSEEKSDVATFKYYKFPGQKLELVTITMPSKLKKRTSKNKNQIAFSTVITIHDFDNNSFYKRLENIISNYTY